MMSRLRWLALGVAVLAAGCPGPDEGSDGEAAPEATSGTEASEPAPDEPLDIESIERAAREAAEAITPQNADEELRRIEFELEMEDPGYETASGYRGGVLGDG